MGLLSFFSLLLLFSAVTAAAGDESLLDSMIREVIPEEETAVDQVIRNYFPEDFDWHHKDDVTAFKHQGLFSTAGAWEGSQTGECLRKQQLVDCEHDVYPVKTKFKKRRFLLKSFNHLRSLNLDTQYPRVYPRIRWVFINRVPNKTKIATSVSNSCDSGCNGELMNNAFEHIPKAGELQKKADYPYKRGPAEKVDVNPAGGLAQQGLSKDFTPVKLGTGKLVLSEQQLVDCGHKCGPAKCNPCDPGCSGVLGNRLKAECIQAHSEGWWAPEKSKLPLWNRLPYGAVGYKPMRIKDKSYWIRNFIDLVFRLSVGDGSVAYGSRVG